MIIFVFYIAMLMQWGVAEVTTGGPSQTSSGQDCRDLQPGESTIADSIISLPPNTAVMRRFRVTRDSADPKKWDLELNLKFNHDAEFLREIETPGARSDSSLVQQTMENRFRQCMNDVGPLQDKDGNQFNLKLSNDPLVPQNEITMHASEWSSSNANTSRNWANDIPCAIMVHESMHLMGLVDSYSSHACPNRPVEPTNSVMNKVGLGSEYAAYSLCACNTDACRDLGPLVQTRPASGVDQPVPCPPGAYHKAGRNNPSEHLGILKGLIRNPENLRARGADLVAYTPIPPSGRPTIMPAHTRMFTKPNCDSANQRYLSCAQWAYRTEPRDQNVINKCTGSWQ